MTRIQKRKPESLIATRFSKFLIRLLSTENGNCTLCFIKFIDSRYLTKWKINKTEVTRVKLELRMNCEWWFEFWRVTRNETKRADEIEQKTKNV